MVAGPPVPMATRNRFEGDGAVPMPEPDHAAPVELRCRRLVLLDEQDQARLIAQASPELVELRLLAQGRPPPGPRRPDAGAAGTGSPELVLAAGQGSAGLGGILAVQLWAAGTCLARLEAAEDSEGRWTVHLDLAEGTPADP